MKELGYAVTFLACLAMAQFSVAQTPKETDAAMHLESIGGKVRTAVVYVYLEGSRC